MFPKPTIHVMDDIDARSTEVGQKYLYHGSQKDRDAYDWSSTPGFGGIVRIQFGHYPSGKK